MFALRSQKNEAQLRQNSFLKRKMAACLRQQNSSPAPGLVWQTILQVVPKNGLLISASKLQIYKCLVIIYKWN
jgi:hypothetical protein